MHNTSWKGLKDIFIARPFFFLVVETRKLNSTLTMYALQQQMVLTSLVSSTPNFFEAKCIIIFIAICQKPGSILNVSNKLILLLP